MRFIETRWAGLATVIAAAVGLTACAPTRLPPAQAPLPPAPTTLPQSGAVDVPAEVAALPKRPNGKARNWEEYRVQVAYKLVDANPETTYIGEVPEPLLAIPVLEIELNANGSVRNISVKRTPTQARDTIQLAIAAVKRAEPFADVSHLPRPWKFSEVFLFNDERRFKPRELDQ